MKINILIKIIIGVIISIITCSYSGVKITNTVSASSQVCHLDHDYHRSILNTYLTESTFLDDRISHGTNGITSQQVQLVQNSDSECAMLDSIFASSIAKTYEGSSDKFYKFTYYKYGNYLFVSRSILLSSDPNRFATGISTFDIFSTNGTHIQGYAF